MGILDVGLGLRGSKKADGSANPRHDWMLDRGTYALVLSASAERRIQIGKLGRLGAFADVRPADFGQLAFATGATQGGKKACLKPVSFNGCLAC